MARVFVSGARGFIGRHLVRALAEAGHEVCGLGHGAWPETDAHAAGLVRWLNGDVSVANLRLLQQMCGTPDYIVHLAGGSSVGAALANPREDFFRTVGSTAELLDWMRADAPRASLLAVSSAAVYGAGHTGRIADDAVLDPFSPYGHHKRLMEELCRSYAASFGLRVCVARLFSVYGDGLTKQLLWDLCTRLSAGADPLTLGGSGAEARDWTHVSDVARALMQLMARATERVATFNVGTGIGTPVRDVARALVHQWADDAAEASPAALAFNGVSRPGDPFSLVAAPGRLQDLGFAFRTPLDRGLADYVRWFRARRS